jgi:hypothetical protein
MAASAAVRMVYVLGGWSLTPIALVPPVLPVPPPPPPGSSSAPLQPAMADSDTRLVITTRSHCVDFIIYSSKLTHRSY